MSRHRSAAVALAFVLALVVVLWAGPGSATASSTPGEHDHMSGMDMSTPSTPSTPSTSSAPAATGDHGSDAHVDLPQGKRVWTNPEVLAEAAIVRVETVADVDVALHHDHIHKFHYAAMRDPQAVATGSYINDRGSVVTSTAALRLDDKERQRFGIRAVNQAFKDKGFLARLPADPFTKTSLKGANRGPNAGESPTKPPIDEYLQNCYELEASVHCAVFVTLHTKVFPSISDPPDAGLEGRPQLQSDPKVTVLDIATDPHRVPLTLQLSNPPADQRYRVVTSAGVNKQPDVMPPGTLTGSEAKPVSSADLKKMFDRLGPRGAGSPIVSPRGDLVAMLGLTPGGQGFEAVPASHLSNDIRRFGISRDTSTTDADFRDGFDLFEADQFGAALPKLKAAAQATGGQLTVLRLATEAASKEGTAADLSDEAGAPVSSSGDSSTGLATMLLRGSVALLVLAGVGLAFILLRRRRAGAGPGDPAPVGAAPVGAAPVGAAPVGAAPVGAAPVDEQTAVRAEPAPVVQVLRPQNSEHDRTTDLGQFCRHCGCQLAAGDRFCFSCGVPATSDQGTR